MTKQALNSLDLYRGGDPKKIKQLLGFQKQSVVDELMDFCQARDINDLSIKLSIGAY